MTLIVYMYAVSSFAPWLARHKTSDRGAWGNESMLLVCLGFPVEGDVKC